MNKGEVKKQLDELAYTHIRTRDVWDLESIEDEAYHLILKYAIDSNIHFEQYNLNDFYDHFTDRADEFKSMLRDIEVNINRYDPTNDFIELIVYMKNKFWG
jgi:hypothetical protein